jgi:predicted dinucleotide-binding enzyme
MKRIGIIGSGVVAQSLAKGFAGRGHPVRLGTREPTRLAGFSAESGALAVPVPQAAEFGELVVLAVKGTVAVAAIEAAGLPHLSGKVVIDTTNPISEAAPVNGVLQFFTGPNDSLMERLQKAAPRARFVKAWNSVGNAYFIDPKLPGGPPTMFICGDDPAARAEVGALLHGFGWDVEELAGATAARALEPLCQLWCARGFQTNQWSHAFRLLRA